MSLPEPTAEELNYGRYTAICHGYVFHKDVFAAGYAIGRTQAEPAPRRPDVPPPPPPPAGRRTEPALTADQQIRIAALTFAASITQHADGMSFRDVEQTSIGMADRAAGWITTGAYDWTTPDPTGVGFGPGVPCTCGPDSVAHTHDAPWGCNTCSCRWYLTRDVNTLRLDLADLLPEDAVETPEQSAAIVDTNLATMGLTVPACRSEYERAGGRDRGDRIVRCHLPAGHPGEHEEADTEVTWTDRHA